MNFPTLPPVYFAGKPSEISTTQAVNHESYEAERLAFDRERESVKIEKIAFDRERESKKKAMQILLAQIGDEGFSSGGVFSTIKKWPKRSIKMCFLDGSREVRTYVAGVARQLTLYGEIDFDFADWTDPRLCNQNDDSDVRISFREYGNWSYIGVDSKEAALSKHPTLNLETLQSSTVSDIQAGKYDREILHEFGHVLGFGHGWGLAAASCDNEFDWEDRKSVV